MVSDSIANISSSSTSPNPKKLGKRRRPNWLQKLEQYELNGRYKQSFSQELALKGDMEEINSRPNPSSETSNDMDNKLLYLCLRRGQINGKYDDMLMVYCETESESSSTDSPTSVLTSKGSWKKGGGAFCCSGIIDEEDEDEEDEGVFYDALDDWDVFFDALDSTDENPEQQNHPQEETKNVDKNKPGTSLKLSKREISNQLSFPMEHSPKLLSFPENNNEQQLPCPVCYEDMDATDLSFFPCPCGFQICLFCHNSIANNGNRFPGFRRLYDPAFWSCIN